MLHSSTLDRLRKRKKVSDTLPTVSESEVHLQGETSPKTPRLMRSSAVHVQEPLQSLCFFCEKVDNVGLRQVMTFDVDAKVRSCANIIKDNVLLGKLSRGDMIAIEAKYHPACLLDLYRKAGHLRTMSM